ncbi:hypothetical protein AVEN_94382-1 [Araneus ventricosus]|uniref:Uncharacterized protein n=1 Tax=Araneus ventricosus TaxID=182803 RepID=A0A4Y2EDM4_ARAVE|nr:hypothetical protein AVEN_94382-1 [Araneus ventricosus]
MNYGQVTRTTPELAPRLQTSVPHQREDAWFPTYEFKCNRPTNTVDPQWNLVSNLEPSDPEAVPLGQRGRKKILDFTTSRAYGRFHL